MKRIKILAYLVLPLFIFTCVSTNTGPRVNDDQQLAVEKTGAMRIDDTASTLVLDNTTPYEISSLYALDRNTGEWSDDLLNYQPLYPNESREIIVPAGDYMLQADILVDDNWYTLEEGINFGPGKTYAWYIDNALFSSYFQAYDYLDSSYGYLGSYDYLEM